jgi:hypothetical protein
MSKREAPTQALERLRTELSALPSGAITDAKHIAKLLAAAWPALSGHDDAAMARYKVLRMENVVWEPPYLSFVIERHGGAALGSSRAELQRWTVNIERRAVDWSPAGRRQLTPMQAALKVDPIADELVAAIVAHREDDRLDWRSDDSVRVLIGKVITDDSAAQETVRNRRKRLSGALKKRLGDAAWDAVPNTVPHVYAPRAGSAAKGDVSTPPRTRGW